MYEIIKIEKKIPKRKMPFTCPQRPLVAQPVVKEILIFVDLQCRQLWKKCRRYKFTFREQTNPSLIHIKILTRHKIIYRIDLQVLAAQLPSNQFVPNSIYFFCDVTWKFLTFCRFPQLRAVACIGFAWVMRDFLCLLATMPLEAFSGP